jgi:metal-responsive CopG/Arc/MetJ family transcriptional regulator
MGSRSVRTTVVLPAELLAAMDLVVRSGRARSRNELLAMALQHELAARERASIDAAFAAMANDIDSQEETLAIEKELAQAGWEAFQVRRSAPVRRGNVLRRGTPLLIALDLPGQT